MKSILSNRFCVLLISSLLLTASILLALPTSVRSSSDAREAAPLALAAPNGSAGNGQALYAMHCLSCHAAEGINFNKSPALTRDLVLKKYGSYDQAYEFISRSMPLHAPGSLSAEEYRAITQYMFSLNGVSAESFNDIEGHWAQKEIHELFDKSFIDGYPDKEAGTLSFRPNQSITRAEFIRYLVKAKQLFLSNSTESEFTDISVNKMDKAYIITAVEYGLINGYPDHTFRPDSSITRAEIAAILARSEMLKSSAPSSFPDVPLQYWARDAISAVQKAHLFTGYEDGTFRPDLKITRGEAVSVLYRLIHPELEDQQSPQTETETETKDR